MQRFRFRLQRILEWQQRVYQTEQERFHQCLSRCVELDHAIAQLALRSGAIEHEFASQPRIDASGLQALGEFRKQTLVERRRLRQELAANQRAVSEQRAKLLAEKRRLQILERLRERARADHQVSVDRELEALGLESFLAAKSVR
ncbi:MAG: hypothetical protein C5B51_29615 [Terriglobia bacterium]|nr:MAG: hypothetical protein C5B51_29615 [Terriglobia bacterium]